MTRRRVAPPWAGTPSGITIYRTPNGWRHSIIMDNGGRVCGGFSNLSADASEGEARSAATAMLKQLALEFHGAVAEITWSSASTEDESNGEVSCREM